MRTIAQIYNSQVQEQIESLEDAIGLAYDTIECSHSEYAINLAKEDLAWMPQRVIELQASFI